MKFPFAALLFLLAGLNAFAGDGSGFQSTNSASTAASVITINPGKEKQVIRGLGFEIQSDSIGSGNHGLPEEPIAVPHDLIPAERERLASEMLKGFRYCRLAGGLYWRGLDSQKKFLQPRWPEQLTELRDLLNTAGVEGLCFEYWSPAPFWKGNRAYCALPGRDGRAQNVLRCFAPGFDRDEDYQGDIDRFLEDFAKAVVTDIKTLADAGLKTSMWGLQNEPNVNHSIYPTCEYPTSPQYVKAYRAVARAIRQHDPGILLFADTEGGFPKKIGPAMGDPEVASLVDAYAVHIVGSPSETVRSVNAKIAEKLPPRPWFQNEYEYLTGGATPDRCLNTVQHIMNSFQLAENPTWFWIHCLKPLKNAEASGYALGFWKSLIEQPSQASAEQLRRWPEGPVFKEFPEALKKLELVSAKRPTGDKPGIGYNFLINQPATVYLLVQNGAESKLDPAWKKTDLKTVWDGGTDTVYRREFPAGKVEIPAPAGEVAKRPSVAHSAFVEPSNPSTFKAQIGMNLPIQIRSETLALERKAAAIKPGHWIFNPYNWNAVGSFVKHMPWNSVALGVTEEKYDANARILAFKKPDGKMTIVLSNRTLAERGFNINTGLKDATFKGWIYTPDEAGADCRGVESTLLRGEVIAPKLAGQSWGFWEQQ